MDDTYNVIPSYATNRNVPWYVGFESKKIEFKALQTAS
jgi:hypothetical protein